MKNFVMALAAGLFLVSTPQALADVELRALYTPKKQIYLVETIPAPVTPGFVVLNDGAVVTGGATVTLPTGRVFTLPKVITKEMYIDIDD